MKCIFDHYCVVFVSGCGLGNRSYGETTRVSLHNPYNYTNWGERGASPILVS